MNHYLPHFIRTRSRVILLIVKFRHHMISNVHLAPLSKCVLWKLSTNNEPIFFYVVVTDIKSECIDPGYATGQFYQVKTWKRNGTCSCDNIRLCTVQWSTMKMIHHTSLSRNSKRILQLKYAQNMFMVFKKQCYNYIVHQRALTFSSVVTKKKTKFIRSCLLSKTNIDSNQNVYGA